ncbi:MAG: hypothetical protein N2053_10240, partial [Chitinispirillaceae bacterium]|nr:hypothetical protein [Chitinispirillaceae bacterium]
MATTTPYYEAFDFINKSKDKRKLIVFYDTPLWYYIKKEYIIDSSAISHLERYRGHWIMDVDYSQMDGRNLAKCNNDYVIKGQSNRLNLIFSSQDSKIYQVD